MDEILVGVIVAVAIAYTVKSVVISCGKKSSCGCGGCSGCSSKGTCNPPEKHG